MPTTPQQTPTFLCLSLSPVLSPIVARFLLVSLFFAPWSGRAVIHIGPRLLTDGLATYQWQSLATTSVVQGPSGQVKPPRRKVVSDTRICFFDQTHGTEATRQKVVNCKVLTFVFLVLQLTSFNPSFLAIICVLSPLPLGVAEADPDSHTLSLSLLYFSSVLLFLYSLIVLLSKEIIKIPFLFNFPSHLLVPSVSGFSIIACSGEHWQGEQWNPRRFFHLFFPRSPHPILPSSRIIRPLHRRPLSAINPYSYP